MTVYITLLTPVYYYFLNQHVGDRIRKKRATFIYLFISTNRTYQNQTNTTYLGSILRQEGKCDIESGKPFKIDNAVLQKLN